MASFNILCVATAAVLLTLLSGVTQATTLAGYYQIYYYTNENFTSVNNTMENNATVEYIADTASAPYTVTGQEVTTLNTIYYNTSLDPGNNPQITLIATIKEYDATNSEIFMYVSNPSSYTAGDVQLEVDLSSGLEIEYASLDYISLNNNISIVDYKNIFTWDIGNLTAGKSVNASFRASHNHDKMVDDYNDYYFNVYFRHFTAWDLNGPVTAVVCIERYIDLQTSILYQHGFTALTFFMAFILGILLVCLAFFIYYIIRRKKTVSPTKANQVRMLRERGKTIMMDENEAIKMKGHTINDYSMIGEGDSIVGVLGMKDKMQMHREIDSLDIVNTVNVDTGLERERNDASMQTTELLISGLHSNKDISKGTQDQVLNNLRQRRVHGDKQQDEEYKREMKKLYKKISTKNRAMMNTLLQRQRSEKKELVSVTQDLPSKERNDLLNLMNEQHLSEQNAETFKLKLEQDEETEKLRKEFAIRTRMGIKEIQLQALTDSKDQGQLSDQQMKWLLAEHAKNQKNLEGLYDEEISKQRMQLEEKLARRKALAEAAETQEEDNDYLLNTMASQQVVTIERLKKSKCISAPEANLLIEEAKKEMIAVKEKMEKDRAHKEKELHKRLSDLKRKRQSDLEKEHELERREYERKCQEMQSDGPIDPMAYADGKLKLLSQQRGERSQLENQIDTEHCNELSKLRNEIQTQTEAELKGVESSIQTRLPQDENTRELMEKLIRDHEREKEALRRSQDRSREKQLVKLQDRLERNREEFSQRKEAEKTEQEQLRDYEEQVVSKLVNSQVSMSEEERARILKEHEKQMVQLENSLTLNKLRQKRMIEEKLAHRRAQQLEKLQLKQQKEKEKQRRQRENNGEDSDNEEGKQQKVDLMKEHVEQKMAVIQGRKLDWDAELESIRVEMLKERSLALKDQEERLGAMVAGLQLDKAKELAKIEEQQRAIHSLKTNLIDDLNERGVLSDPETQAVITRHQQEQEQLNQRLDAQRVKQEKMLKQKLQLRLEQREKSMIQAQDEELKNLMAPNKTAAKIKKMLLIHNHMVAMEKMRNQLEREISQTLEQVKYEYELCKRKAVQDQEMEFIAGLVRVGTIPKEELENILHMLYPGKSEKEFKEIFDKLFDPALQPRTESRAQAERSHLTERVKIAQQFPPTPLTRRASQISMIGSVSSNNSQSKRSSFKKKKGSFSSLPHQQQQQLYDNNENEDNSRFRPSSRQFEDNPGFNTTSRFSNSGRDLGQDYKAEYNDTTNSRLRSSGRKGRPSIDEEEVPRFRPNDRNYDEAPHPLEAGYKAYGQKQNGHAYANPIMEERDDDVVSAQYVSGDYDTNYRQPAPSKLPPLQEKGGRKKKKKKFLKKMASPRADYYDDDDLL